MKTWHGYLLIDMTIKQSSLKTVSFRYSTMILDFLGDIGGFKEAILLLIVVFGEYFSAQLIVSKIAE